VKSEQLKEMKTQAHMLKPVIMIGNAGLTEAVNKEIDIALNVHALIKIKMRADRDVRKTMQQEICESNKAELIQSIGQIIVIYREKPPEPEPKRKKQAPRRRD